MEEFLLFKYIKLEAGKQNAERAPLTEFPLILARRIFREPHYWEQGLILHHGRPD